MRLILFTNSYPYGIGEMWKHNELKLLAKEFSIILVLPLHYADNKTPKVLNIGNVKLNVPILNSISHKLNFLDLLLPFVQREALVNFKEIKHLLTKFSRKNLIKFLNSTKRTRTILNSEVLQGILRDNNSDTVLYFYWGLGSAEILPLIDVNKFKKVIVRMHRFDLYEYENDNYIPFRKQLLNKKITILPSSDDGKIHLKSHYKKHIADIRTQRCGVLAANDVSLGSSDDKLKIVSCSFLVPVKRINLMIEAAALLNIPFEWHHIGYGKLEYELKEFVRLNRLEDRFKFIGKIDSELVLEYHIKNNFDLFVNTSRSEGVPFSIMEAFSVAIPVIATDAGGTKEIVDETVGCLLNNDVIPEDLKNAIEHYYNLSNDEKKQIRQNAFARFNDKCDMEKLTKEFIEILKK
jgi:colanic acid/amylovoran biosynthesis glycosyltransferase